MSNLRKPLVIVVLHSGGPRLEGAVLAATVGRNGKAVTAVRTVTNDVQWINQSLAWVDMPDMKPFVTVPDQKALS